MSAVGRTVDDNLALMHEEMDRCRGQLFEALEAFGLPERQEAAAKRLVRRLTYASQSRLEAAIRQTSPESGKKGTT